MGILIQRMQEMEQVATKYMRKIKSFWIAIAVIVSFLCVQISYNGTPSNSIFSSLVAILYQLTDKGWNFELENFKMNFTYVFLEFFIVSILLLFASILEQTKLTLVILTLFVFLWFFWLFSYEPYIEVDLYLLSSLFFLILAGGYFVYLMRKCMCNGKE